MIGNQLISDKIFEETKEQFEAIVAKAPDPMAISKEERYEIVKEVYPFIENLVRYKASDEFIKMNVGVYMLRLLHDADDATKKLYKSLIERNVKHYASDEAMITSSD